MHSRTWRGGRWRTHWVLWGLNARTSSKDGGGEGGETKEEEMGWDEREKKIVKSMHVIYSLFPNTHPFLLHASFLIPHLFSDFSWSRVFSRLPQVHAVERFVVCDEGGVEGVPWGGRYDVQRRGAQVRDETRDEREGGGRHPV